MSATTPFLQKAEKLGPLASRYVEVESLPWKPTPCAGIDMKILLEDPESGLLTALFRWQPGAELALHEPMQVDFYERGAATIRAAIIGRSRSAMALNHSGRAARKP